MTGRKKRQIPSFLHDFLVQKPEDVMWHRLQRTRMFGNFIVPYRRLGLPYLSKARQPQGAAIPIPIGVCSIFLCPNNGMAASVWDFNVRTDVYTCDCTHRKRVCSGSKLQALVYDILLWRKVPESDARSVHWKLTLGEKLCRTGDSNPRQYCTQLFSRMLYQLSYSGIRG